MHHNTNIHFFKWVHKSKHCRLTPVPGRSGVRKAGLQWHLFLNHTLAEEIKTESIEGRGAVMHLMIRLFSLAHSKKFIVIYPLQFCVLAGNSFKTTSTSIQAEHISWHP
jgi:hypothetical protein